MFLRYDGLDRHPVPVGKRRDGRALHARQHFYDLVHLVFRSVQQYIFLAFRYLDRFKTEQQFVQDSLFFIRQVIVSNQQGFALHDDFHFFELIAHQRAAGADDIENRIREADARRNFHRPANYVKVCFHSLFSQISLQYFRIGSCDRFSGEPFHPLIIFIFRNGE